MFVSEPSVWAQSVFQSAKLGDLRRTKRLVQLA
ncbi:transposase DNA-binding-containing protein, partial [Photobacterium halotolerans]